jgi:hypothetical protein
MPSFTNLRREKFQTCLEYTPSLLLETKTVSGACVCRGYIKKEEV